MNMGFFDFLQRPDINAGLEEYHNTKGAVLLDVRTEGEFAEGHVPGSKNVPLDKLEVFAEKFDSPKDTPLFLYCHSGARSGSAAQFLKGMSFSRVKNIGGIWSYRGKVER